MKLLSFHTRSTHGNLLIIISVIAAVIVQVMDKSFGNTFTLSLGNTFHELTYWSSVYWF